MSLDTRATYSSCALCLRPSGRARPTSCWPWVGTEDRKAAEASSWALGPPTAARRPQGVVLATRLVAWEPVLVHEKGVILSCLVFYPDGPRPAQHLLHLPKLWLVSRLSQFEESSQQSRVGTVVCWGFTVRVPRGEVTCQYNIAAEWQSQHCTFKPSMSSALCLRPVLPHRCRVENSTVSGECRFVRWLEAQSEFAIGLDLPLSVPSFSHRSLFSFFWEGC